MSLIERNAGRLYAMEMLQSVDGMPRSMFADSGLETVARNLEAAAERHPPAYAEGIREVTGPVLAGLGERGGHNAD